MRTPGAWFEWVAGRAGLLGVLACQLLGTVGCASLEASDDRVNPQKPLWYQRPSGAMNVLFLRRLTAPGRVTGEPYERGRAEIDPRHGRLFVGTSDHGLYALRANDGSSIWRFETLGSVQSEPLYDPELDVVYFGSNDGALYAVHAADGRLVWRFERRRDRARKPVRSERGARLRERRGQPLCGRPEVGDTRSGTFTARPPSAGRSGATAGRRSTPGWSSFRSRTVT